MITVELFCYQTEYIGDRFVYDVFKQDSFREIGDRSAIEFMEKTLLTKGQAIIKNQSSSETDDCALIEVNLQLERRANINCNDHFCKTTEFKGSELVPVPPCRKSGFVGRTAQQEKMQIKINCPSAKKCGCRYASVCYAYLAAGKCTDKLVVETIGKTFFKDKYIKQR